MTEELQERESMRPSDPRHAASIARRLTRQDVTPGDIARLKRMAPESPTERIFWEACISLGIDNAAPGLVETWAGIFQMIAKGTKINETAAVSPHDGTVPFGRALAIGGYSESRLKTLLNAGESSVADLLDRATGFLYANGERFNWNDAARLAMTKHRRVEDRERDRMKVARDYYREVRNREGERD